MEGRVRKFKEMSEIRIWQFADNERRGCIEQVKEEAESSQQEKCGKDIDGVQREKLWRKRCEVEARRIKFEVKDTRKGERARDLRVLRHIGRLQRVQLGDQFYPDIFIGLLQVSRALYTMKKHTLQQ